MPFIFVIFLTRMRELVALLLLSNRFLVTVNQGQFPKEHNFKRVIRPPKMHPHSKLGTIISNDKNDMLWLQWPEFELDNLPAQDANTNQIWDSD